MVFVLSYYLAKNGFLAFPKAGDAGASKFTNAFIKEI